jgi:CO/xanthine dehydrogenase FAD-binding subunit
MLTAEPTSIGAAVDLNTVTAISRPRRRDELHTFAAGDCWLAGGTWLFSEPQPNVERLIDLSTMGWTPLTVGDDGLTISATCTIAELFAFQPPVDWRVAPLFQQCCNAFLASFKIWNTATVGGNVCLALPAGPMISLAAALEGECLIWMPGGGERRISVLDFVRGPMETALERGELLRAIHLPRDGLRKRSAFRQIALSNLGRSAALLIGTRAETDQFALTITASTRRPLQCVFRDMPDREQLAAALAVGIPDALYYDDIHGRSDWRRHMTLRLAEEIRAELEGGRP